MRFSSAIRQTVGSPLFRSLLLAVTSLREANLGYERTLFETACLTGAREGELLALRWTASGYRES